MEIADNQHPIDLSRKCGYYESPSYTKSIPASRPLPDLIPISVLGSPLTSNERADKKRDDLLHCFNALSANQTNDFQFKEQSKIRKELSRFRSVPHLSKNSKISRLKSNSDSRICSISDTPIHRSLFIRNVPIDHANSSRQRGKNHCYSSFASPPQEKNFCWKTADDDVTSSMHIQSSKHTKPGPGVSLSTIQSLRKLLDKRKSQHRDT